MPPTENITSGLLHEFRLELHGTNTVNFTIAGMIACHKTDILNLSAHLDHQSSSLDLQVVDHIHSVTVTQGIAVRVHYLQSPVHRGRFLL